jgi:hypothetical protein
MFFNVSQKPYEYSVYAYLANVKNLSHRDRMVVEITTTCVIVAYHHLCCEFELHAWREVLDKTLCDKSFSVTCVQYIHKRLIHHLFIGG